MTTQGRDGSLIGRVGWFLLGAVVFAVSYSQAPLYFSNQHQYFLRGLTWVEGSQLGEDWLANTRDSTPVFTFLAGFTARYLHENLFYVYYALLMGVYLVCLMGLYDHLAGLGQGWGPRFAFFVLVLLFHAALPRVVSMRLFGNDYPWYFQAGVAGQYLLGPIFQPSTFGVFLLASLLAFVRGRPFLAVTFSSLTAVCHSTYLLPAAMLTASYLAVLFQQGEARRAFGVGALAVALVVPVVAYNLITFAPSSAENLARAQDLLVHFRIPHHAIPRLWSDGIAIAQVGWVILGIALAYGTRLFGVLLVAFVLSALLTVVQVATDNDMLALMFPWRLSTVLVPVSTAVILARLVLLVHRRLPPEIKQFRALGWSAGLVCVAVLVGGGLAVNWFGLGFHSSDEELPLLDYIKAHKRPGDVYLIPVSVPNLEASVRGSSKSDFKPLPSQRTDRRFIPVDLQRFRLYTHAPIFVDFKSIPYWDRDVLAWRERLEVNEKVYRDLASGNLDELVGELEKWRITHIVTRADRAITDHRFRLEHVDAQYRLYRLIGKSEGIGRKNTKKEKFSCTAGFYPYHRCVC
jgi:hypothetical protein